MSFNEQAATIGLPGESTSPLASLSNLISVNFASNQDTDFQLVVKTLSRLLRNGLNKNLRAKELYLSALSSC